MKTVKWIPVLLVAAMLLTAGCSKKVMESQSVAEPEPEPVSQTEPEPEAVEPEPEPEVADQDMEGREKFVTSHVYFDFDSAILNPDARELLMAKAQWLKNNPGIAMVRIEGHCDERGTEAYNIALGARRAEAVKNFMLDLGVNGIKLETMSFGEEKPVDPSKTETAWAVNRRACFVIDQ